MRSVYLQNGSIPWVIGFSGGKDSTVLLQLVIEAVQSISPDERKRDIYVVCNDTLVESPVFQRYVESTLEKVKQGLEVTGLPIKVITTKPKTSDTFWVNLLGRGYPAPNRSFRWCTDRMKIRPTTEFIKRCISENGEVVLLLGVRKSESSQRAKNLAKREIEADGSLLKPHDDLKGCLVYTPIIDLTTDDIWVTLVENRPPWGSKHNDLFEMYNSASDGECPFVMSDQETASCGSGSARFGCWTCTVVEKDKSLDTMAEAGFNELLPLAKFRSLLKETSENPDYRSKIRRNGQPGLGPLTIEARKMLMNELVITQSDCGADLISNDEIRFIEEQWEKDKFTNLLRDISIIS
jgi:DNA sulfur modification protein DndC